MILPPPAARPGAPVRSALSAVPLAALLAGCASSEPVQRQLTLGPDPVPCADGRPGACLRTTGPGGDVWIMGIDEIAGFTYEPGFTYELLVEEASAASALAAAAPPQLTLIEVLSKQPAAESGAALVNRLGGRSWRLASLQPSGYSAAAWAASDITLQFDPEAGRLSGFAGCNSYTASFTLIGERLQVAPAAATLKACPSETTMALEREYLTRIAGASAVAIAGDRLDLSLADGGGAEIRAAPE